LIGLNRGEDMTETEINTVFKNLDKMKKCLDSVKELNELLALSLKLKSIMQGINAESEKLLKKAA
jgi:hypothetical protein